MTRGRRSGSMTAPAATRPYPVCGALASGITSLIILIFVHGVRSKGWGSCGTGFSLLLPVMFYGPMHALSGIGFGITGLLRRERWRGLSILGVVLGSYPVLWLALSWIISWVESAS